MEVIYLDKVFKDLKKIKDEKIKSSLKEVFISLEETEDLFEMNTVKKLSGHPNAYRIRIGDYRLGFFYYDNKITIARFINSNDIYKLFS